MNGRKDAKAEEEPENPQNRGENMVELSELLKALNSTCRDNHAEITEYGYKHYTKRKAQNKVCIIIEY
jgi:hypothetical protein